MAQVGALRITLGANTAQYEAGMRKAAATARRTSQDIRKSLAGVGGSFAGLTSGIIAGLSTGALVALTHRALEYAGGLKEVATQIGVTTTALQELRYAASQTGVAQEQLDKGLAKLNLSLSQARAGAETQRKAFQELSRITGVEIVNSAKDASEVMRVLADAYVKTGKGSDIAALGAAVMGRNFQKMLPLLEGGRKGIDDLAKSARELGLVLSEEQIQKADETADKLAQLKQVLEARIAGIVADNAESILSLATSIANLAAALARFWSQDPMRALTIIGALAGGAVGSRFGLPGAAVGAVGGALIGRNIASQSPQGQREQANVFLRRAREQAAARGFFRPGTTQAEKDRIMSDVGIKSNMNQFRRLMGEARKMEAGVSIAAPKQEPLGDTEIGDFLAGGGKKGGGGGKDTAAELERKRKQALQDAYDKDRQISDAKADELRAEQDLLFDYVERAEIDRQLIDIETDQQNKQLDLNVALAKIDGTYDASLGIATEQLKASNERLRILKKQAVNQQVELDRQRDFELTEEAQFKIQRDRLQVEASLAETAAERRRVELQILDIAYKERRQALQRFIDQTKDEEARKRAEAELRSLPAQQALETRAVLQSTRGPLEQFQAGLPTTADKMNEALQLVATDGLQALEQGILDVIDGTKSLGQAFRDMASQIIAELLRIQIQRAIIAPLSNILGNALGVSSLFGGGVRSAGLAQGSADLVSAFPGIFQSGGFTGFRPVNKIAGLVHGQEYVFDAEATRRIGVGNLEAMRRGLPVANDNRNSRAGDTFHMPINIPAGMTPKQARETGAQFAAGFQQRIAMAKRQGL